MFTPKLRKRKGRYLDSPMQPDSLYTGIGSQPGDDRRFAILRFESSEEGRDVTLVLAPSQLENLYKAVVTLKDSLETP